MDETNIIALLIKRAAGEIDDAESKELDEILAKHPDALYYERFLEELWKKPAPEQSTDSLFARHLARHGAHLSFAPERQPRTKVNKRNLALRLVALTLLFAFFTAAYLVFHNQAAVEDTRFVEYAAQVGTKKQITLPDGTTAWLNSGSKLRYPVDFASRKTRAVQLEGEAFFDVVRNEKKPFTIATDKITIKVLGTSFNVMAYPEDTKTETTLITGEIELSVNERPAEKINMKPNEKVAVFSRPSKGTGQQNDEQLTLTIGTASKVQVADKEYIKETSWKDNKLIFKNEPFKELAVKLGRWYGVEFSLENKEIGAYRFSGTITKESLEQTLVALQLIHSFNYKIIDHDVIIQ